MPRNDLEFLKDPDQWPNWPYLPLKRHDEKRNLRVAVLFSGELTGTPTYRIAVGHNMYALAKIQPDEWVVTTPEQVIADGWKVD